MQPFLKALWYLGEARKYYYEIDGIITVINVENLQIIVKECRHCHCNLHVYHNFFHSFHDVTRWYFLVFSNEESGKVDKKDIVLPKYVPYDARNGIITKKISIDIDSKLKYPRKHFKSYQL